MTEVPRRLAVLFLLAAGGIVVALGAVIGRALGTWPLVVYAVLAVVGTVVAVQAAKAKVRDLRRAAGRTCDCCTGSVHDPIQVI